MVTNEMIYKAMDIILRGLSENLCLTIRDMEEMNLNGHPASVWHERWGAMPLSRFWCMMDDGNRQRFVEFLVKRGKFSELC